MIGATPATTTGKWRKASAPPPRAYHDGSTARLRSMEPGDFCDFKKSDANRIRVMAQRIEGAMFCSRLITVDGARILRVWRLM